MILDPNVTNNLVVNYFSTLENKFINLHGAKYSYEHSVYTNAKTPITIYCKSCNTEFKQTSDNHLQGKGCKACAMKVLQDKQRMSLHDFITKSQQIHGTKFDYSKVQYISNNTPVTVICLDHGEFQISPTGHWVSKTGCTECGSLEKWNGRDKPTTESFIKAANDIHINLYDYDQTVYAGRRDKVKILCKTHGIFEQSVDNHLKGAGCPSCATSGFKPDLPGLLYYLKIQTKDTLLYKIGITNNSVNYRFSKTELELITVISEAWYDNGQEAYDKEQRILKEFKQFKYLGPNILKSGNTELFSIDVLNKDLTGN